MRFLLVLTALMLAVAAGIWWKTTRDSGDAPNALDPDPNLGAATFGLLPEPAAPAPMKESAATPASLTRETPAAGKDAAPLGQASAADAVAPGSKLTPAGGGDPPEPQSAANEKPAAPPAAAARSYVVKSGDTFYRIVSRAYGTAPQELLDAVAKANGLRDPSQIKEGQKLTLPSLAGWPAPKKL
jgi:nucleoid-associated protein YgaU